MVKTPEPSIIDDDEIDLLELIQTLWAKKVLIIAITTCFIILAGIHTKLTPYEYKSETTFFMASSEQAPQGIMGYAAMLGVGTPSNIEGLIKNVLGSYSIKANIAKHYEHHFKTKIATAINEKKLKNSPPYIESFIIGTLKLNKKFTFSVDKNNLFKLTYSSTDKTLSRDILNTYLDLIVEYNKNLELSAEKNIITIIDAPRIPLAPFKPNLKLNVILGFILGLFSSCIYVLVRSAFQSK